MGIFFYTKICMVPAGGCYNTGFLELSSFLYILLGQKIAETKSSVRSLFTLKSSDKHVN
jgi:hypothetical protein